MRSTKGGDTLRNRMGRHLFSRFQLLGGRRGGRHGDQYNCCQSRGDSDDVDVWSALCWENVSKILFFPMAEKKSKFPF